MSLVIDLIGRHHHWSMESTVAKLDILDSHTLSINYCTPTKV